MNKSQTMYNDTQQSTMQFLKKAEDIGFGGSNYFINKRLDNAFNQQTGIHNDSCAYENQIRIARKPMKYYTNRVWAPSPTNQTNFRTFTPIGNQRSYNVQNNLTYPAIGKLTSLRNKKFLTYIYPLKTSPGLGFNHINTANIDINSNELGFGIGEITNKRDNPKQETSAADYNRWQFVDPNLVQNPQNIIFADGVIPRGGIDSRNQLQNYAELNSC